MKRPFASSPVSRTIFTKFKLNYLLKQQYHKWLYLIIVLITENNQSTFIYSVLKKYIISFNPSSKYSLVQKKKINILNAIFVRFFFQRIIFERHNRNILKWSMKGKGGISRRESTLVCETGIFSIDYLIVDLMDFLWTRPRPNWHDYSDSLTGILEKSFTDAFRFLVNLVSYTFAFALHDAF